VPPPFLFFELRVFLFEHQFRVEMPFGAAKLSFSTPPPQRLPTFEEHTDWLGFLGAASPIFGRGILGLVSRAVRLAPQPQILRQSLALKPNAGPFFFLSGAEDGPDSR
jgi:hypothetical protein